MFIMELIRHTKVMSLNRITVPKNIMELLNLKQGEIAAFYENNDHDIVLKKGVITPAEIKNEEIKT